jgi:hypothetical protein
MTSTATAWDALQKQLDSMPKPIQVLKLCSDPDVRDRYQEAKQALAGAEDYLKSLSKDVDKDARALVQKKTQDARNEFQAAQAEYDACTVTLTFQALERGQLKDLIAAHPPTEEDEEQGSEFHFDTFAPALIAAASTDGMPAEYAEHAVKAWSLADSQALWNAAWGVQQRRRTDLGKD